jgi:preprotein translocase subunit SecE
MLGVRVPPVLLGVYMINKIVKYYKETRLELAKVAWPSRTELRDSTVVVIVLSLLLSIFIGIIDYALSRASTLIFR